jgi:hypothetical protein
MGQIEAEIYTIVIPRPEGVTPRANSIRRAKQNRTSSIIH